MSATHERNRTAWDVLVRRKHPFTQPAGHDQMDDPLRALDSLGWLNGGVRNKRVLCLGAGGGKYGPLFAAAGADVVVVDLSPAMLSLDRQVASELGLTVRTIEASMDDLSMLGPGSFDIVAQPVSTCYVPDIVAVYRQVARATAPGGLYLSQHKQPASLQMDYQPAGQGYAVIEPYYRTGPLPAAGGSRVREPGTIEFLHRWDQLVGGLCRAGFVVEDLVEPCHADPHAQPGSFGHRCQYAAPYVRIKARRLASSASNLPSEPKGQLIVNL